MILLARELMQEFENLNKLKDEGPLMMQQTSIPEAPKHVAVITS